jgi:hypothetical protein
VHFATVRQLPVGAVVAKERKPTGPLCVVRYRISSSVLGAKLGAFYLSVLSSISWTSFRVSGHQKWCRLTRNRPFVIAVLPKPSWVAITYSLEVRLNQRRLQEQFPATCKTRRG